MIRHKKPRGHSNVYADETERYPDDPAVACIPMIGGAQVHTCKPLPPLALHRDDWEKIGLKMGWLPPTTTTVTRT